MYGDSKNDNYEEDNNSLLKDISKYAESHEENWQVFEDRIRTELDSFVIPSERYAYLKAIQLAGNMAVTLCHFMSPWMGEINNELQDVNARVECASLVFQSSYSYRLLNDALTIIEQDYKTCKDDIKLLGLSCLLNDVREYTGSDTERYQHHVELFDEWKIIFEDLKKEEKNLRESEEHDNTEHGEKYSVLNIAFLALSPLCLYNQFKPYIIEQVFDTIDFAHDPQYQISLISFCNSIILSPNDRDIATDDDEIEPYYLPRHLMEADWETPLIRATMQMIYQKGYTKALSYLGNAFNWDLLLDDAEDTGYDWIDKVYYLVAGIENVVSSGSVLKDDTNKESSEKMTLHNGDFIAWACDLYKDQKIVIDCPIEKAKKDEILLDRLKLHYSLLNDVCLGMSQQQLDKNIESFQSHEKNVMDDNVIHYHPLGERHLQKSINAKSTFLAAALTGKIPQQDSEEFDNALEDVSDQSPAFCFARMKLGMMDMATYQIINSDTSQQKQKDALNSKTAGTVAEEFYHYKKICTLKKGEHIGDYHKITWYNDITKITNNVNLYMSPF